MINKHFKHSLWIATLIIISLLVMMIVAIVGLVLQFDFVTTLTFTALAISPYMIIFIAGFYWIFQTVTIDKSGIALCLFSKRLKYYKWEDIEKITVGVNGRFLTYTLKLQKNECVYLDASKYVDSNIKRFAPESCWG